MPFTELEKKKDQKKERIIKTVKYWVQFLLSLRRKNYCCCLSKQKNVMTSNHLRFPKPNLYDSMTRGTGRFLHSQQQQKRSEFRLSGEKSDSSSSKRVKKSQQCIKSLSSPEHEVVNGVKVETQIQRMSDGQSGDAQVELDNLVKTKACTKPSVNSSQKVHMKNQTNTT